MAKDDQQLVAKWYLNDDPQPIYNGSSFTKFRSLNLVRDTTNLGGRYSCRVKSLPSRDAESILMMVYGESLCC
ncbi:hypothetical protein IscW_ISCW004682 [Ixodes scapularis]|uniref:Ig-like domain-containing protein n=1 Tax=Ixodes scapularis TaxID=6945 RepID=B7PE81_IXOSC|nr:hypothetical protein IscW_ISCW004682 [Ixodes scapularis]|eukprot:XP_002400238.1 hypothetical protein IscW_ISCW004682 [Ixodes scapularis]